MRLESNMPSCTCCVLMLINAYVLVKNRLKKTIVNLLVRLKGNSKCTPGTYNSLSSCPIVLASTGSSPPPKFSTNLHL